MTVEHQRDLSADPRTPVELRPAWRLSDPRIERDAELFWQREALLGPTANVSKRLQDLCLAGYSGETLIAVSTASIRVIDFLGVKLAMLRLAIARSAQRHHLALYMTAASRKLLEEWSAANPSQEVMGMGGIAQVKFDEGLERLAAHVPDSGLNFIGWTANNEPMFVAWFAHGTVPVRRHSLSSPRGDTSTNG